MKQLLSDKEAKARELAGRLYDKAGLRIETISAWSLADICGWLDCMDYIWNGETWHKQS